MSASDTVRFGDIAQVTDYVANGSFAALKQNVTYRDQKDHAILVRLVDFNSGWSGPFVFVDKHSFDFLKKSVVEPGDVVISNVGANAGTVFRVPDLGKPMTLGPNSVLLKGISVPDFWYYFFSSHLGRHALGGIIAGSAQPKFNKTDLRNLQVPVIPEADQKAIANILNVLDDKIELNRKAAATLEEMARALYRSWFVDFDPVHAKASGRTPDHMDTAIAALFPDSFDEEGVPEGWECGNLSDLIDFNPREKLPKGALAPYLDMKALPTAGMSTDAPYDRAFTSGTKFRARDTLLARITPCLENGKTAMVDCLGEAEVGWGSTEFIVMRAKNNIPPSLPYCVARDASFREDAIASMTGSSGRQRADAKTIAAIEAAIPAEEIVMAFGDTTMPMIEKIHQLGTENQTLATLRDTLLPRLMSGELRVGEAEKQVEAAT